MSKIKNFFTTTDWGSLVGRIIYIALIIGVIWLVLIGIGSYFDEKEEIRMKYFDEAREKCLDNYRHCEDAFDELYGNLFENSSYDGYNEY